VDLAVAVALAVLGVADALHGGWRGPPAVNAIVVPAMALSLAWRQRRPLIVLASVMGGLAALSLAFGGSETSTAVFINVVAVFSAAAHVSNAELPVALALIAAGVAVHDVRDPEIAAFGDAIWNAILLGLTFLVGLGMRQRQARTRALEAEAESLRRERETVALEAVAGQEALRLVSSLDPDVVLMDIRMPLLDGIEATRRLCDRGARVRVLVLTTYGLDEYVYEALKAGAAGFLLKTESPPRLIEAVHVVAGGEALLAPEITRRLIARFVAGARPNTSPPVLDELTDRERQVLAQVARGLSNAEIGSTLSVSPGTVKTHVARILSKLGLRDRVQAVVFAYECGIVQPGQAADPSPGMT